MQHMICRNLTRFLFTTVLYIGHVIILYIHFFVLMCNPYMVRVCGSTTFTLDQTKTSKNSINQISPAKNVCLSVTINIFEKMLQF